MDDTTYFEQANVPTAIRYGSGEPHWVTVAVVDPAILVTTRDD